MRIETMAFYNEAGDEILSFTVVEHAQDTRAAVYAALGRALKGLFRVTDTGPNHVSVEHEWDSLTTMEEDLMDALFGAGFDLPEVQYGDGDKVGARVHAHLVPGADRQ